MITPIRLGFSITDTCPSGIWVFEAFIDLFFFTDLFLNFITGVEVRACHRHCASSHRSARHHPMLLFGGCLAATGSLNGRLAPVWCADRDVGFVRHEAHRDDLLEEV